jgi:predicted phage-related endonuclease
VTGSSDEGRIDRRLFIGGSDARTIMSGDEAALIRLWREKRGESEPRDLSDNLIVQLGVATEALNRGWYERNAGRVVTDISALDASHGASLDGRDAGRLRGRRRRRV